MDRFIRGQFVGRRADQSQLLSTGDRVNCANYTLLDLPSFLAATVQEKNKKGSGQWRVNVEQTKVVVDMIQKRTTPENWPSQFEGAIIDSKTGP